MKFIIEIAFLISSCTIYPLFAELEYKFPRVGVVKGEYEKIEDILKDFKINFKYIKYKKIEKIETYKNFDVIFLPCGIDPSIQTNIDILSRGKDFTGLSLKDEYYKVDGDKTGKNLKIFIAGGGIVYFSDFSCKYLQKALKCVKYYKNFPHLGMEGFLKIKTEEELHAYSLNKINPVYLNHAGWVFPADIVNGKILMHAQAETPLGIRKTILGAIVPFQRGEAVYSGLHLENLENGLKRFFIFRTIYGNYLIKIKEYLTEWEQKALTSIVDKSLPEEIFRKYTLKTDQNNNYLYFFPNKGEWQIDLFDNTGKLLLSKQGIKSAFYYKLPVLYSQKISLKIFSNSKIRYALYAALSVTGKRNNTISIYYYFGISSFILILVFIFIIRRPGISGKGRV